MPVQCGECVQDLLSRLRTRSWSPVLGNGERSVRATVGAGA